jgi:hypothetical protein
MDPDSSPPADLGAKPTPPSFDSDQARFAAALLGLEAELDWTLLGQHYCYEGGEDFFSPEQIEALRETGLRFASDLVQALEGAPKKKPSLYVGAGVAELAPILCERLLLRREVTLVGIAGAECRELNRALTAVEAQLGIPLPRWSTKPVASLARQGYHHLWMVSVLTDPEAFPAFNRLAYSERKPRPRSLAKDRERAEVLLEAALSRLEAPAVLFTTDEELPWMLPVAERLGLLLETQGPARLSGIVGDPVRRVTVRGRPGSRWPGRSDPS